MIQGKWIPQGADSAEVYALREAVFGRGRDDLDALSQNVVVYEDDTPVGTGRLWWQDGSFRLGDLGVLPEYRGRRMGDLLLRLLLFKAQSHYAREVRLRSPRETAGFFARLGFHGEEGSADPEEMFLAGDEIDLDTCKSCKKQNCPSRRE